MTRKRREESSEEACGLESATPGVSGATSGLGLWGLGHNRSVKCLVLQPGPQTLESTWSCARSCANQGFPCLVRRVRRTGKDTSSLTHPDPSTFLMHHDNLDGQRVKHVYPLQDHLVVVGVHLVPLQHTASPQVAPLPGSRHLPSNGFQRIPSVSRLPTLTKSNLIGKLGSSVRRRLLAVSQGTRPAKHRSPCCRAKS